MSTSPLYDRINRLYNNGEGPLDEAGLDAAVAKGWITEVEKALIMGIAP